jgi:predicted dehydrogenase
MASAGCRQVVFRPHGGLGRLPARLSPFRENFTNRAIAGNSGAKWMNLDEFLNREVNRRQFLGNSAKNAAGMAAGMVGWAGAYAQSAPGERVSVAVIGVRNQGKQLAASLAGFPDVDVTALCDVDEGQLSDASQAVEDAQGWTPRRESDFRRLLDDQTIDAVVIAAPDHWHAHMAISACQAGKDVYLETPVAHNIFETGQILEASRKYDRVIQTGLQQRSGAHFQSAVEFVRSGKLGDVKLAKAWMVHRRKSIGFSRDDRTPRGVDYDAWLGPAPLRRFNGNRFHYNWRWFWDYGAGELGNWGVQMLDIARWGLGVELPTRVSASGGRYYFNDDQETPDTLVVHYTYPGRTIVWEHRKWSNHGIENRSSGTAFYGENGTLVVDRGGWKVYDRKDAITADTSEQHLTHCRGFIDSVKSRSRPAGDIELAYASDVLCHLGNAAFRLGREVVFDPESLTFGNDAEANALLSREYRKKWPLPEV